MKKSNRKFGFSHMSVEEYLASQERSRARHEFVDGIVYEVEASTRRHNLIAGNLYSLLKEAVKGSTCKAYMSDVMVHVESTNSFYFPDVLVSCDYFDNKSVYTNSPTLVVEVLSPSTASVDKREKVSAYEKVPTLKEYLIVHQRTKCVQYLSKNESGKWNSEEFRSGETFAVTSLPCLLLKISVDDIYEDITYSGDEGADSEVREEIGNAYLAADNFDW